MIDEKKLFEIGKILKPHGINGEVTVLFKKPEFADIDTKYYFFSLDGLYVPFFVEEYRYNSDVTARVKFKGVNSIEEASIYSNAKVSLPDKFVKGLLQEEKIYETEWHQFIGYTVYDENSTIIGVIHDVDSSTVNILFIILDDDEEEILIPATSDFIIKKDCEQKQLYLQIPEGLLE